MSFDNIKLEKGLYTTGKSFTSALEALDPSENYKGTALEGLDAFERQLKRFDIKVSGSNSDTISKFFSTTDSAVLFPEYISRAVQQGVDSNNRIENIIATTTSVDSLDYRSIQVANAEEDYNLSTVSEGNAIPEFDIKLKDKLTHLKKYGRMITASYEALKFQKLDLFSVTLKRIGEKIANSQFTDALGAVLDEGAHKTISYADKMSYDNYVDLWTELNPYNLTTLVVDKINFANLLKMPEFRDSNAGLDFHATGNIVTPFGASVIPFDTEGAEVVMALDKNYAIEKVEACPVTTEYDKLIDRQLERATISTIVGFSPIFSDAFILAEKA